MVDFTVCAVFRPMPGDPRIMIPSIETTVELTSSSVIIVKASPRALIIILFFFRASGPLASRHIKDVLVRAKFALSVISVDQVF